MRTSSRELGELAHKGVFVLVGKGRQSRYELKSNRARIAPIAPNAEQQTKPLKNKGKLTADRSLSPQATQETTMQTNRETNREAALLHLIRNNPRMTIPELASRSGISYEGVRYHLRGLSKKYGLHHEGPTKKGRWVFGPKP